jgi:hypothetical protein
MSIKELIKALRQSNLEPVICVDGEFYPIHSFTLSKGSDLFDDGTVVIFLSDRDEAYLVETETLPGSLDSTQP